MIAMGMVQPAVDEIVDMVAMRHLLMSTVWTVRMWAAKLRRAFHGVCGVDRDDVFVHVIPMHMVQMAVVKIIDMALVANRGVSAIGAMLMGVVGVVLLGACGHWRGSFRRKKGSDARSEPSFN